MSKFIKHFTIYFLIPAAIFGISTELLFRNIPNHYTYKKAYLDKNSGSINILVLGSSYSYNGVNPAFLKFNGFNAANPAQTLDIDFELLKKYYPSLTNLKWIVLPVGYPSLAGTLDRSTEAYRICNYVIYYDLNVPHKLTDYSLILNNNLHFCLNKIVSYYLYKINDRGCSDLGWGTDLYHKPQQDLDETGKLLAMQETVKNNTINDNLVILKSIINYVKGKEIKVLLFTQPAWASYIANLDSVQLSQTIAAATEAAKDDANVVYVNLLSDNSFTKGDFHDADHLNEKGTQKLTLKLDSIMGGNN